ncbi:hypothetical protein [uncultured Gammaproteobacteria bacterium]|nr:hypothetical protein [uncultured Gammaproteobacteria bacterium]
MLLTKIYHHIGGLEIKRNIKASTGGIYHHIGGLEIHGR